MKFSNLVFIVLAFSCLINMSISVRKMRKDITNNNGAADGTAINNNNNGGAAGAITNNNGMPAASAAQPTDMVNNNNAGAAAADNKAADNTAAAADNKAADNSAAAGDKMNRIAASKKAVLEIKGYAESMIDQDEMNFLVRFANDPNAKFFKDLEDLQKNIADFKKALLALNIPDEDFAVKENVNQFGLMRKYLKKLTFNVDMKDDDGDNNNNNNNNNGNNNNNNNNNNGGNNNNNNNNNGMNMNMNMDNLDMNLDDFDLNALFFITVRDNKIAEKLVEAIGQFKGKIEDVNFSISDKLETEERSKLLSKAIDNARQQADFIAQQQGFNLKGIRMIDNDKYLLVGQVMTLAVEVKFDI